jgi:hypothetical protein
MWINTLVYPPRAQTATGKPRMSPRSWFAQYQARRKGARDGPGRLTRGHPEHHPRLSEDDRLQGHPQRGGGGGDHERALARGKKLPAINGRTPNGSGTIPSVVLPVKAVGYANLSQLVKSGWLNLPGIGGLNNVCKNLPKKSICK